MPKTTNLGISADGLGVFVPMPNRLACWMDAMSFFPITGKKGSLTCDGLCCVQP